MDSLEFCSPPGDSSSHISLLPSPQYPNPSILRWVWWFSCALCPLQAHTDLLKSGRRAMLVESLLSSQALLHFLPTQTFLLKEGPPGSGGN